jgi:uncharacterized repeat protein (TIGR04052 family)
MKKILISVAAFGLLVGCGDDNAGPTGGSGGSGSGVPAEIAFEARVDGADFVCDTLYEGLGTDDSALQFSDFRLYVHDVEMKNAEGDWVPVELEEADFQGEGVVLLDFEDCAEPQTWTEVLGTLPDGDYEGLRFTMGVPFEINHANKEVAAPPLNLTTMHWDWQGGYKFLRLDSGQFGPTDWRLHLGSTNCDGDPVAGGTTGCANPNRVQVEFPSFRLGQNRVVADLARLVDGAALSTNQEGTPVGCMAAPADSDCAPIFDSLGLPFGDAADPGPQTFFTME